MHVHTAGCGNGYTLHVHTDCDVKGYSLHVHTVGCGNGYTLTLYVSSTGGGKGIHQARSSFILLAAEMDTPCTSILLAVKMDTLCTSILLVLVVVKGMPIAQCMSKLQIVKSDTIHLSHP